MACLISYQLAGSGGARTRSRVDHVAEPVVSLEPLREIPPNRRPLFFTIGAHVSNMLVLSNPARPASTVRPVGRA